MGPLKGRLPPLFLVGLTGGGGAKNSLWGPPTASGGAAEGGLSVNFLLPSTDTERFQVHVRGKHASPKQSKTGTGRCTRTSSSPARSPVLDSLTLRSRNNVSPKVFFLFLFVLKDLRMIKDRATCQGQGGGGGDG